MTTRLLERLSGVPFSPTAQTAAQIPRTMAVVATLAGLAAWLAFASQDLVLSHYDAKAHLVVARRVLDSLTPGWHQLGAVWLPLPHLINLLPVQVDALYRTGAFASLVSVACLGLTGWAATRLVISVTGSRTGAMVCGALLVLNPNLLYLHATPMTESMAIAASFLLVIWMYEWVTATALPARVSSKLGWALAAATWTRYEAWLVIAAAIAGSAYALRRRGLAGSTVAALTVRLAAWPAAAVMLFLVYSRVTTDAWFVAGGFYEIDPFYEGLAWRSIVAVWWGTHQLTGYVIETAAIATALVLLWGGLRQHSYAAWVVPVSLAAAAALPAYAFFEGHPYRVRYMTPVAAACAVLGGIGVGLASRRRPAVLAPAFGILLVASSIVESPPWDLEEALIAESRWDTPRSLGRRRVTACLARAYGGERVFASMASLAHYMQELAHEGFDIADFVHEGNGPLWNDGLEHGAARQAGWMLAEEQSEGGDVLARRISQEPGFARGMSRMCEGGGVALYQRR